MTLSFVRREPLKDIPVGRGLLSSSFWFVYFCCFLLLLHGWSVVWVLGERNQLVFSCMPGVLSSLAMSQSWLVSSNHLSRTSRGTYYMLWASSSPGNPEGFSDRGGLLQAHLLYSSLWVEGCHSKVSFPWYPHAALG